MRRVTFSMGISLDGYIVGPHGAITSQAPDEDAWAVIMEEIGGVDVHLMGRRLYETMLYWEDDAIAASFDKREQEWTAVWRPLPKVVFSTTLTEVQGAAARLATGSVAEEIERLRAEPGEGVIAIGGATLAAAVAALGLIDEYRIRIYPVLVGGGIPYFPADERQEKLELVDSRTLRGGIVYLRYRVVREAA